MAGLARWAPRSLLPDLLPGEDRSFGSGLFVDLVPRSCWFTNVRTCVAAADWDWVRQMVFRRAEIAARPAAVTATRKRAFAWKPANGGTSRRPRRTGTTPLDLPVQPLPPRESRQESYLTL
jgi:hypothetical protein